MASPFTPCRYIKPITKSVSLSPHSDDRSFPLLVSAWKTPLKWTGSCDLPSPSRTPSSSKITSQPKTPSPTLSQSRSSQATTWRRGSGDLPSPPTTPPSPPRRARKLQEGNWRSSAAPPPPTSPPECFLGRVVMLPFEGQVPTTSIVHREVSSSPWGHPHVITKAWDDKGVKFVKLRTCTSFHGVGITYKKEHHRHYFVEADRNQLAPESDAFTKTTHVNCSPGSEFTIEHQYLQNYLGQGKKAIQFTSTALESFNKNERIRRDSLF